MASLSHDHGLVTDLSVSEQDHHWFSHLLGTKPSYEPMLSIGPLGEELHWNLNQNTIIFLGKMHLKISSAKCGPFYCSSVYVHYHYCDVIMNTIASQITSLTILYLTVNSGTDQRKHQSSASLAFVRGIHRRPVNSPHKGPVTRKMFPFDDVIMMSYRLYTRLCCVVLCFG